MSSESFENSSFQLRIEKLNEKNYREWTQSIKLLIDGKGKFNYLTEETKEPAFDQPISHQKWRYENSMIRAWQAHSMHPTIGKTSISTDGKRYLGCSTRNVFRRGELFINF